MIQTTSNIKELSQTNSNLLTQSIRMIEQSVDMIANMLMPKPATYGKNVAANTVDMTPNIDHNYFGTSTISHNA
jgi:hypothetical protein